MSEALGRMNEDSDWELVARARAGDMRAFSALVARYQTPILRFCRCMTRTVDDAEELAQESFVRIYRHLNRLEPKAKFSTVLFGIARNLTLNFLRDTARRVDGLALIREDVRELPVADPRPGPGAHARRREVESIVEQALEALSPEHREVLVLREMDGLDYATIGRITHCPAGTVKSRIARAREQLREQVLKIGGANL
ncbi:MAG TPA: sigma-70 family RNA polymerase sigma factor [Candidatus Hydrogenedentes bacterium]|nr:sigma-70 family RNA polymerase sigma factor [Candidatus Hydrogenedentota bacterium]